MNILLTADWQARFNNLDFCKRAHMQELSIIKKYNVEAHIDLGDGKDEYNPMDGRVAVFATDRANAIARAVSFSRRLLGNHCRFGQHDDSSNWLPLLDYAGGKSIAKPTVEEYDGIAFFYLPFLREWKDTKKAAQYLAKKAAKSKAKIKLLLFHNEVAESQFDLVQPKRSTTKLTRAALHFDAYTYCFGGHIHLRQQLGKNGMFVGNPFATDAGEINQTKGFTLYNTDTKELKFIKSDVPGLYSWDYVKLHRPESLPDGTKIRATVECSNTDDYHDELDKVATAIEKRYPNVISYVLPKFTNAEEPKQEIVVDPDSSDFEKVRAYIKATVPEHLVLRRKQLAAYMAAIIERVSSRSLSRSNGKLYFEKVVAKNVLSFDKLEYNFLDQGLVCVRGNNKDWPGHSNGSGKSNFLSIIPIVLHNRTFKDQKNDSWANDSNKGKAVASLYVRDELGRRAKITRTRRPFSLKMAIEQEDVSTGLRSVGKKETQGQIEEFTGYTFETLANSIYIDQRLSNAFLVGTPRDRAELIHSFQNLERFTAARGEVVKELSLTRRNRELFESSIEASVQMLDELDEELSRAKTDIAASVDALAKELSINEKAVAAIVSSTADRRQILRGRLDRLDARAKKLQTRRAKFEGQMVYISRSVQNKRDEFDDVEKTQAGAKCSLCKQILSKDARKATLDALKHDLENLLETEKALEEKRAVCKTKQFELRKSVRYLDSQLTSIQTRIDAAKKARDASEARLAAAKEVQNIAAPREDAKRKRAEVREFIARTKQTIKAYADEELFLEYVIQAFSRDGLPAFLSNLLIPQLNKAAAHYARIFIDSEIQVVFDVEKGQIVPNVINAHGATTLQGQSMGESAWAGLITSFALREIAPPSNLLILDEPGNGLDPESAKAFGQRLPKLREYFDTILVVTHNPALSSALADEKTLTVVKSNKISSLQG